MGGPVPAGIALREAAGVLARFNAEPKEEIGLVATRKLSLAFPHHQSE